MEDQKAFQKESGHTFANAIAYIFNPLIFPPLLFGIVLNAARATPVEAGWVLSLALVVGVGVPLGVAWHEVRHGRIASINMSRSGERRKPYLAAFASFGIIAATFIIASPPAAQLLTVLSGCYAFNALLVVIAARRWKLSVHVASVTGFLSIFLFLGSMAWWSHHPLSTTHSMFPLQIPFVALVALLALTALAAWSRVHTGAHTAGEVAIGALAGFVLPPAELALALLAGWI